MNAPQLLVKKLSYLHRWQSRRSSSSPEEPILAEGDQLLPDLVVLHHLRRGSEADIYEVWSDERHCSCIAKIIRPKRAGEERVQRALTNEANLLLASTHPHIVRAYAAYTEPVGMLLETLEGQTLEALVHTHWRTMDAQSLAALGLHISSAITYLHARGILHVDLKPSNIISDSGRAKIIDLNLARPPGFCKAGVGTGAYLAPEQARGGDLSTAVDVWGIGAVLFEAATRREPFPRAVNHKYYPQLTTRLTLPARARGRLPAAIADLIDGCLEPAPQHRPTVGDIETTLDPFAR